MGFSFIGRKYGWKPSRPDSRNRIYRPSSAPAAQHVVPMTAYTTAYDQLQLGSCVGNGVGRLWAHRMRAENRGIIMPSRLFVYYNARQLEGDVNADNGCAVADGLKGVVQFGVPKEQLWPYDPNQFATSPTPAAYAAAAKDIALQYQSVPVDLSMIKSALSEGNPVVGGFTVFQSFEDTDWSSPGGSGVMPMPADHESTLGGHCVLWDGFDDATQTFWCVNSWGGNWGCGTPHHKGRFGWFKMPYAFLPNCSDFWIMTKVA
jgi:C1A family cysteine protease